MTSLLVDKLINTYLAEYEYDYTEPWNDSGSAQKESELRAVSFENARRVIKWFTRANLLASAVVILEYLVKGVRKKLKKNKKKCKRKRRKTLSNKLDNLVIITDL